jgi:SnoaL-like polyketide cyclase
MFAMNRNTMLAAALATAGVVAVSIVGIANPGAATVKATGKSAKGSTISTTNPPIAELDSLRKQVARYTKGEADIAANLKTFDNLDYDVFSNQKWDRLKESHSSTIKVVWPDGHFTTGIDKHIADLKNLFVFAPDTRIKDHPIAFGKGNMTVVEGVMQGTFTQPMPDGKGGFIQPTGKSFRLPMATIGLWRDGTMYEEHLFWDNQTYNKQLGL